MSSSIFSSKSELTVIGVVLAVVLCCEVAVRSFSERLSIDIGHIHQIPTIVQRLRNAAPVRVLFLGNSLTRDGVDNQIIKQGAQPSADVSLSIEGIYPDDTTICDWYYIYQTYLSKPQVVPEHVVLGFVLKQLEDGAPLHMGRLGGYFAKWSGIKEAFEKDIPGVGDRIHFTLSTVSSLFANQERIRERLLDLLVPQYRSSAQVLNRTVRQLSEQQGPKTASSYDRLRRFIRMVHHSGSKLIFVAMPLPNPYPIAAALEAVIREEGATLVDMRTAAALPLDAFPDRYHLSDKGAKLYSTALASTLKSRRLFDKPSLGTAAGNHNHGPANTGN